MEQKLIKFFKKKIMIKRKKAFKQLKRKKIKSTSTSSILFPARSDTNTSLIERDLTDF